MELEEIICPNCGTTIQSEELQRTLVCKTCKVNFRHKKFVGFLDLNNAMKDLNVLVNDYCVKRNIPLISASVIGYDGYTILFNNSKKNHLCLRCIFPNRNELDLPRCETVGVLGTAAGMVGMLTANKIVNFLISKKNNPNNLFITYFLGKNLNFKQIKIKTNPNCLNFK